MMAATMRTTTSQTGTPPSPFKPSNQIARNERMSLRAVGFSRILHARSFATHHVDSYIDVFKVLRVDATSDSAQMVQ
jgi:hypothetical protein